MSKLGSARPTPGGVSLAVERERERVIIAKHVGPAMD